MMSQTIYTTKLGNAVVVVSIVSRRISMITHPRNTWNSLYVCIRMGVNNFEQKNNLRTFHKNFFSISLASC